MKKGQLSLGDAPQVVMIVGLVFLVMATIAYIAYQSGDSFDVDNYAGPAVVNESVTGLNYSVGDYLSKYSLKNVVCTVSAVKNATSGLALTTANYTTTNCLLKGTATSEYNENNVKVDYTYTYSLPTSASNITDNLSTEINNNTSIAGIVLTISLIGIVLTVLIGVFLLVGRKRV